jgi:hypothetical protein
VKSMAARLQRLEAALKPVDQPIVWVLVMTPA